MSTMKLAKDCSVGQFLRIEKKEPTQGLSESHLPNPGEPLYVSQAALYGNGYLYVRSLTDKGLGPAHYLPLPHPVEVLEDFKLTREQSIDLNVGKGTHNMGSDPEIFAVDKDGVVIPAFLFLPKEAPRVKASYMPYYDGFQAEFNIPGGGYCHDGMVAYFSAGLRKVLVEAQKFNPSARLTHAPLLEIPPAMMMECSETQVALGCSPSQNAYTEVSPLKGFEDPRLIPFRFAGCHLHFEEWKRDLPRFREMVKILDAVCGVMMVPLLDGLEDYRRRKFYGLAGEFRTPKHGLEWRTPSSAILAHPTITYLVLDVARAALTLLNDSTLWITKGPEQVQDIINNGNKEEALKVLKENSDVVEEMFQKLYGYGEEGSVKFAHSMVQEGAKNVLPTGDMGKVWMLHKEIVPSVWLPRITNSQCPSRKG